MMMFGVDDKRTGSGFISILVTVMSGVEHLKTTLCTRVEFKAKMDPCRKALYGDPSALPSHRRQTTITIIFFITPIRKRRPIVEKHYMDEVGTRRLRDKDLV